MSKPKGKQIVANKASLDVQLAVGCMIGNNEDWVKYDTTNKYFENYDSLTIRVVLNNETLIEQSIESATFNFHYEFIDEPNVTNNTLEVILERTSDQHYYKTDTGVDVFPAMFVDGIYVENLKVNKLLKNRSVHILDIEPAIIEFTTPVYYWLLNNSGKLT